MTDFELSVHTIAGEMLRKIRKDQDIKTEDVAEKLGITARTIERYENGSRKFSVETLKKLCTIYKIDYENFMKEVSFKAMGKVDQDYAVQPDVMELAKEISTNPELLALLEMGRQAPNNRLKAYIEYMKKLYE